MRQLRTLAIAAVAATACLAAPAQADWLTIDKPYNLYGHLYNTDDGTSTGTPKPWCAATATVNSFVYLQNKYPGYYDNKLTPDGPVNARNQLVNGWVNDQNVSRSGTGGPCSDKDWWEHKVWWLEDHGVGGTIVHGMVTVDPSGWHRADALTLGFPTWQFLWTELEKCQDIEIGIDPLDESGDGHALTLTSMKFDDDDGDMAWQPNEPFVDNDNNAMFSSGDTYTDLNGNQQWDLNEAAQIDYIDPNNPTQKFWVDVVLDANGRLLFTWTNGGANPDTPVVLDLAYVESVPEPATIVLLIGSGCVALLRRRAA